MVFLVDINFFDRAVRSTHPVERHFVYRRGAWIGVSIVNKVEARRVSHHPTKHAGTPHSCSLTTPELELTVLPLPLLLKAEELKGVPPKAREQDMKQF